MSQPHVCIYGQECWCGATVDSSTAVTQRVQVAGVGGESGWPMKSDALGVHPNQRQHAYDESVRLGVPTQFDRVGRAILTDMQHRRKFSRALGYHDRDGFLG